MKNLQTIVYASMLLALSFSGLLVYAEGDQNQNKNQNSYEKSYETGKSSNGSNTELREQLRAGRDVLRGEMQNNRQQMKNNKTTFAGIYGTSSGSFVNLDAGARAKMYEVWEDYQESVKSLREEYTSKIQLATTVEAKQALREEYMEKVYELRLEKYEDLIALVPSDIAALTWLQARMSLTSNNHIIMTEMMAQREEFRGERNGLILAYKEKYIGMVGMNIDKIAQHHPEKLELVLVRIEEMMDQYEANTQISQFVKDRLLDRLDALKELIEDALMDADLNAPLD